MLTRGQMKRIVERLPESELRFLSQVMEGMLAVYRLQRDADAAAPVGSNIAREKAMRPLNEILEEIEQSENKDPLRQVMNTPIKDLLDRINSEDDPVSNQDNPEIGQDSRDASQDSPDASQEDSAPPSVASQSESQDYDPRQTMNRDKEQAFLEARKQEQQNWTV